MKVKFSIKGHLWDQGKDWPSVSMIRSQENLSYYYLNLENNGIKTEERRTLFLENIKVGQREWCDFQVSV